MADANKSVSNANENVDKKVENDTKTNASNDDDMESNEEQPLDIGANYLVKRSDESWRNI